MRSMISPGLAVDSSSYDMPQPSSVPGRKFSISTSARAISRLAMSWPSLLRRSSAIERLLRDCTCHQTEVPSLTRRQLRSGSPVPGASILITSAPKSPSVLPANGPAINWPISTTFRPSSAPGVRVIRACLRRGGHFAPRGAAPAAAGSRSVLHCPQEADQRGPRQAPPDLRIGAAAVPDHHVAVVHRLQVEDGVARLLVAAELAALLAALDDLLEGVAELAVDLQHLGAHPLRGVRGFRGDEHQD